MNQNSEQIILIVDNLSPFTKDIVKCVSKLGAKYMVKSSHSLANAIFSNDGTKFVSQNTDLDINKVGHGYSPNTSVVKVRSPKLGIDLNDDNDGSSSIGHADKFQNGKFFVDKVILSGRRANDRRINAINSQIIMQCLRLDVPLLGICYGAEILALTLGGAIKRMPRGVQENVSITVSKSSPLISNDARPIFYESHRYCVARLPEGFESLASSIYCEHEIFSFKRLFGTQFHPEKSGVDGFNLISKFVGL